MTDPALLAALQTETAYVFGACEIAFPGYTLRVLDGSGELVIGGNIFHGEDPTFGVLDSLTLPEEQMGDEAPEITLSFLPPSATAAAVLAGSHMQGSIVRLMFGAFNPQTNGIIGIPEQLFLGEIDVPTYETSRGQRSVSYTAVSVFERLFEVREGERAADGWHQSIWPGERGLEYVTGTVRSLYWGARKPVQQSIASNANVRAVLDNTIDRFFG